MCGRYTLRATPAELAEIFDALRMPEFEPRYNLKPTNSVVVVRQDGGQCEGAAMRWWLVPHWWKKSVKEVPSTFNARAETVATAACFRGAWARRQRCLVPANNLFEWTKGPDGKKLPWLIRTEYADVFAFAGIWDRWTQPDGTVLDSCSIITTEPSGWWQRFHRREAVILPPESYDRWLDPETAPAQAQRMLKRLPDELIDAYRVSTRVNNVRSEGPDLVEPLEKADDRS